MRGSRAETSREAARIARQREGTYGKQHSLRPGARLVSGPERLIDEPLLGRRSWTEDPIAGWPGEGGCGHASRQGEARLWHRRRSTSTTEASSASTK